VAAALAHAHARGVVHRDIKPENIRIDESGGVRVLDFGIAKLPRSVSPQAEQIGAVSTDLFSTVGERVMGTPGYMSPEQARGEVADASSDVFSFGVLLYELLVGERPFRGATSVDVLASTIRDDVPVPSQRSASIPEICDRLVARCLAKAPAERYRNGSELLVDVEAASREVAVTPEAEQQPSAPCTSSRAAMPHVLSLSTPMRRRLGARLYASTAMTLLTIAIIAGAVAYRRGRVQTAARALDFANMIHLDAATFTMGRTAREIDDECRRLANDCRRDVIEREQPAHSARVSAFFIDADEVTNEAFAIWLNTTREMLSIRNDPESGKSRFVYDASGRLLFDLWPDNNGIELGLDGHFAVRNGHVRKPVVEVTWDAADGFCHWYGKRLPTEAEWEFAARGTTSRRFPWGDNEPTCATLAFGRLPGLACEGYPPGPEEVGRATLDVTPSGVRGLGGNVSEWVRDAFTLPYYADCGDCIDPAVNTTAEPGHDDLRVFRGGSWGGTLFTHASARGRWGRSAPTEDIGFRCAVGTE
jgi:serine/threonine-protein kinase